VENPYAANQSTQHDAPIETQPDGKVFRVWIGFFLLTGVCSMLAGALLGGITGGILAAAGANLNGIRLASGVVGFLASMPISYFFFRRAVRKLV